MAKTKISERKPAAKSTNSALVEAIERGDGDALAVALARGISSRGRRPRISPLEQALRLGQGPAAQLLIAAGADLGETDDVGRTALHRAPDVQTARLLVVRGVDVDVADADGQTALHLACAAGDAERVRLLIAAGADLEAETTTGKRPLLLATTTEARQALLEAGATDLLTARGEQLDPRRETVAWDEVGGLAPGCLTIDAAGVRWFGGGAQVFRHDGAHLERFTFDPALRCVACAVGGASVFFATNRGLLEANGAGSEWRLHDTRNSGLFDSDLIAVACDREGVVHALGRAEDAQQKPVSTWDGERWGVLQPGAELPQEGQTRGLGFDAAGELLLLLDDGFAQRAGEAWAIERSIGTGGILAPTVHQAVGRGNSTFFVTSLGLFRYRRGRFDRYETPHPPQVICFAGDYLYIGMVEGGLAELTLGSKELRVFDRENSALEDDNVTGLAFDPEGNLWVESGGQLLALREGELQQP